MLEFNYDKMLFTIPANKHSKEEITSLLKAHPEIRFVSMVGIDLGGNDTDERIPVKLFIEKMDNMLQHGVQTDGSSVVLPRIAQLNNAKVDIIPDKSVNWYVDYNYKNVDRETGLPIGTLRIPAFLLHNDTNEVGSRVILRDAIKNFKEDLIELIRENPYVCEYLPIGSADDIDEIILTSATELEFWVKTPDDEADREQLSTAQILKEQYWKRTAGPVRTALEETLIILDHYGFEVEMGHKEVGGVKAKMGNSGKYDHVMEQLEIDWKYADAMQAADNENMVKYVVRDIFRCYGLDVSFMAKPVPGVAGSGAHTHMGIAVKLKDGRMVNLFSPLDPKADYLSPIGFGALAGILKNYEVINPFVSSTNDAFNRLKPGFEAPICIVTSLGRSVELPSRNRTVLVGLVRDISSTMATRFELRSPNPRSNTYLVIAAGYMAMLDGIKATLEAKKTSAEMLKSISKKYGEADFYLEKDREYRSESDVFEEYTPEERDKLFGKAPRTVWENINAFEKYPERLEIFKRDDVMTELMLESYKDATIHQWALELRNRILPNTMDILRKCRKKHNDNDCTNYDVAGWMHIAELRDAIGRDSLERTSMITRIAEALDAEAYDLASELQVECQKMVSDLRLAYAMYEKNLF
ncbi:MAG: glutamine synthetase [Firmicutes bacterium]|nr:glutamine synthetase [Bacillota bacterium]